MIAGPNIAQGQTSPRPVSLVDLYPTLLELSGLPAALDLDGVSFVPLLKNPQAPWERPGLTTAGIRNHALRTERWRYIRYADGREELDDHDRDPLEQKNIASQPESTEIKEAWRKWLAKSDTPRTPNASPAKNVDD